MVGGCASSVLLRLCKLRPFKAVQALSFKGLHSSVFLRFAQLRPFKAVQTPSLIPRFQMTVHSFMTSCSKVSRLMALLFTDER